MKNAFYSRYLCSFLFTIPLFFPLAGFGSHSVLPASLAANNPIHNLETCFSPDEGCDTKLISFINAANKTLDIAIYSVTHADITDAILAAKKRGVAVRMVVDRLQSKGAHSSVPDLIDGGIDLKIGKVKGLMHDKFTILDGIMLEEGSYNYTENATKDNAENQLYLTDAKVIQRYQDNFEKLWAEGIAN